MKWNKTNVFSSHNNFKFLRLLIDDGKKCKKLNFNQNECFTQVFYFLRLSIGLGIDPLKLLPLKCLNMFK